MVLSQISQKVDITKIIIIIISIVSFGLLIFGIVRTFAKQCDASEVYDTTINKCRTKCVAGQVYDYDTELCGNCANPSETMCKDANDNDTQCYDPGSQTCDANGTVCSNDSACAGVCCDPGTYCDRQNTNTCIACPEDKICKDGSCCNDPNKQCTDDDVCCDKTKVYSPDANSVNTKCCNGTVCGNNCCVAPFVCDETTNQCAVQCPPPLKDGATDAEKNAYASQYYCGKLNYTPVPNNITCGGSTPTCAVTCQNGSASYQCVANTGCSWGAVDYKPDAYLSKDGTNDFQIALNGDNTLQSIRQCGTFSNDGNISQLWFGHTTSTPNTLLTHASTSTENPSSTCDVTSCYNKISDKISENGEPLIDLTIGGSNKGTCSGISVCTPDVTNPVDIDNICTQIGGNRCCSDNGTYTGQICPIGQMCTVGGSCVTPSWGFSTNGQCVFPNSSGQKSYDTLSDCLQQNSCLNNANLPSTTNQSLLNYACCTIPGYVNVGDLGCRPLAMANDILTLPTNPIPQTRSLVTPDQVTINIYHPKDMVFTYGNTAINSHSNNAHEVINSNCFVKPWSPQNPRPQCAYPIETSTTMPNLQIDFVYNQIVMDNNETVWFNLTNVYGGNTFDTYYFNYNDSHSIGYDPSFYLSKGSNNSSSPWNGKRYNTFSFISTNINATVQTGNATVYIFLGYPQGDSSNYYATLSGGVVTTYP
jgi:hypothetical protein